MPWKVIGVVERRKQFVEQWQSAEYTMTELCAQHGISRQAGYNTLSRYQKAWWKGLEERSRAPRRHPNQTAVVLEQIIVELRRKHMGWGPRKFKAFLEQRQPQRHWPAASTIGAVVTARRVGDTTQEAAPRRSLHRAVCQCSANPTHVWCADFKGWGRTQDGERIDPLTVSDAHSRYLVALPGGGQNRHRASAVDFRSCLPRVWHAAGDSHRQRRALCFARTARIVAATRCG